MNKQQEQKRIELMNDLLTMIDGFRVKIKCEKAYIKQWASPFGCVTKSNDAIDMYLNCIYRLETYYKKVRMK